MKEFFKVLKCPKCGAKIKENWLEYQSEEPICYERQMGSETQYIVECEDYECPKCHALLKISGSLCEYPEGAYNMDDINITLCYNDDEQEDDY